MRFPPRVARLVLALVAALAVAYATPRSSTGRPAPSREVVRAGTSGDYPPLSLWRGDRAVGLAPSLLEAFGASANVTVAWTRFGWPSLAADLENRRFDVAADGITVRPERSILGRFTVPFARGGAVLLLRRPPWAVPTSGPVKARAVALDRAELRIVVNRGGHLERVTRSLFRAATIQAITGNAAVRAAFARGDADAAMTNTFEAPVWSDGVSGIERIGPLTRDVTAFWVRADRGDLEERLDDWLLEEEASGRLAALRRRSLGRGQEEEWPATALPLDALLAAAAERLSLMPFVAAAKKSAGQAVEDPAQEAKVIAAASEAVAKAAAKRGAKPPMEDRTAAFFRAQIEAAKNVQQLAAAPRATYALESELRPAIARISTRMASLVVRLPPAIDPSEVVAKTREALAESGVDEQHVEALANAVVGLVAR